MDLQSIFMILGFMIAAYSIIANDAIQTLGTFLSSNSHRPWWVLWIFAGGVAAATLIFGWVVNGGDPAYGRLEKFPMPEGGISFLYLIPPIVLLILTRFGIPVSTTFLILSVFAAGNIQSMVTKSLMGYVVAFVTAIVLFYTVFRKTTEYFSRTKDQPIPGYWVALQWISTGFLWSQWLIQDLANIFAYVPREVGLEIMILGLVWILALLAFIFRENGGAIQKIVTSKTNTTDIRAATIIDFIFGIILFIFKELSNIPMSTTWVFLGLLAGREFAISFVLSKVDTGAVAKNVGGDAIKAFSGLVISLVLALVVGRFV